MIDVRDRILCASVLLDDRCYLRCMNFITDMRLDVCCCLWQAELSERKTFLSDSKQVLLRASDALNGQQTKQKMAQDDRSVSHTMNPTMSSMYVLCLLHTSNETFNSSK